MEEAYNNIECISPEQGKNYHLKHARLRTINKTLNLVGLIPKKQKPSGKCTKQKITM